MTLLITYVDKDRIVQVSDRRLTRLSGDIVDDEANKAIAVGMSYVHFTACYTGLAFLGRKKEENRTDRWLQKQLGSITRDGEPDLETICKLLSERATNAMSRLLGPRKNKGLKVMLAGFDNKNRPFRATVSNIKFSSYDVFDVRDRFVWDVKRFHSWSPLPDIDVAGAVGAFEAEDKDAKRIKNIQKWVTRHLRKHDERLNSKQVARKLVTLVRAASTHSAYGWLIGRACMSVVAVPRSSSMEMLYEMSIGSPAEPSGNTPFAGYYHPVSETTIQYGPLLVDPYMDTLSMETDSDPPAPLVHKDPEKEAQRIRQVIADYYTAFYDEVRRHVSTSAVEIRDTPYFLRDHRKRILIAECQDGFIVLHFASADNASSEVSETFEFDTGFHDKTVSKLTGETYQPATSFGKTTCFVLKEEATQEYVEPEGWECHDVISYNRATRLTPEQARHNAREDVRSFLHQDD